MAYQAKRSKKYVEDFELVDAEGNIKHTLHISLDADDMTVKINRKYVALTRALSETTEAKRKVETAEDLQGVFETLGNAMVDLLQAVFGEENAKILLDFYEIDNRRCAIAVNGTMAFWCNMVAVNTLLSAAG